MSMPRIRPTYAREHGASSESGTAVSAAADGEPGQVVPGFTRPVPASIVSNSRLWHEGLVGWLAPHTPLELTGAYTGAPPVGASLPNPPGHVVLLDCGLGSQDVVAWAH